MKYLVWALFCVLGFSMTGVARADETQVGVALPYIGGLHIEPGLALRGPDEPVPVLFVDHRSKRWELFAESDVPLGPQHITGVPPFGAPNSFSLNYADASARYAITRTTQIGFGESIWNQRTFYQLSGLDNAARALRIVGAQYQVIQTLYRRKHGALDLTFAYNPHMTARMDQTIAIAPHFNGYLPENGTQFDTMLRASSSHGRTTLYYGVRYLDLTMHASYLKVADQNLFFMPFVSIATSIGR